MVAHKTAATLKRSRHTLAMTPLTRQVMTKSIHRAILEYQQSNNESTGSPKSPLDLRVRTSVIRSSSKDCQKQPNDSSAEKIHQKSIKSANRSNFSSSAVAKSNSLESNSKMSPLETVYEQEKDARADELDGCDHGNVDVVSNSYAVVAFTNDKQIIFNGPSGCEPIGETPVLVSRKSSSEKISSTNHFDNEIWYTPKEFVQSKVVENIEVLFLPI